MALSDLARGLISFADTFLKGQGLEATITHKRWASESDKGTVTWVVPDLTIQAVVQKKQQQVKTADGRFVMSRASLFFPRPITINLKDRFVLTDGTTGPLIETEGLVDPTTGNGFVTEVWLG